MPRRTTAGLDPATLQQYAAELKNLADKDGKQQRVKELAKQLKGADLRALAESLGASGTARTTKDEWIEKLLDTLTAPPGEKSSSRDEKIARLTEILAALKSKAEGPDAPTDEIEAELRSLEQQMDRDEAIAVAKRIGVVRHVDSRTEAIEEIRRTVFETKRAREAVAH